MIYFVETYSYLAYFSHPKKLLTIHKNKNAILFYQENINDNLQFILGYNKLPLIARQNSELINKDPE